MKESLKHTPLHALHLELGGRMVPFAGYEMPVQYADGIMAEHRHTRDAAGLFDVSHMGQARIVAGGPGGGDPVAAIERLVPGDVAGLDTDRIRYTQLTNARGGIIDDLMVTRLETGVGLVVNASRQAVDYDHISAALPADCRLEIDADRALLALQGPKAADVLERLAEGCGRLRFMESDAFTVDGIDARISRCGYTGEDGFEISVPAEQAGAVAERLLDAPEVAPIGLGARDSLRLEAGLCLWGHDIDETTTPVEAALAWSIGKRRRAEGGFVGEEIILDQLKNGPARKRVGLRPEGRAPAREGAEVVGDGGRVIGHATSGGFGPTVGGPVAMGYVETALAEPGTEIGFRVRGKELPGRVAKLPFVPAGYVKS